MASMGLLTLHRTRAVYTDLRYPGPHGTDTSSTGRTVLSCCCSLQDLDMGIRAYRITDVVFIPDRPL
jgi:hypothetical protein